MNIKEVYFENFSISTCVLALFTNRLFRKSIVLSLGKIYYFDSGTLSKNVRKKSEFLRAELSGLFENYRSIGHLIAFDFSSKQKRDKFVSDAYLNGLLINPTAESSVRLRPNLAFSDDELDKLLDIVNICR
jgi:acetylornithine/succinyldiaminopimelate/putrescine aminotransferase